MDPADSSDFDDDTTDDDEPLFDNNPSISNVLLNKSLNPVPSGLSKVSVMNSLHDRNVKLAKACIMIVVILERAAYYSLLGNLGFFINVELMFDASISVIVVMLFAGMSWFTCFFGALFGDVIIGRFKTIIAGLICYIIGFVGLTCLSKYIETDDINTSEEPSFILWFCFTLIIISMGEGCFKSNIPVFGADQIVTKHEDEMRTFFNYFYWATNIGAFFGYSALTLIQQQFEYFYGYLIPTILLFLGLFIFLIPSLNNYHIVSSSQNLLSKLLKIIWNSRRKRSGRNNGIVAYETYVPVKHWLDRAKIRYGGKYADTEVEDVKSFVGTLPLLLFLIVYCILYYQMMSSFLIQGLHMRLISFSKFSVPACWFALFDNIIILIFVPIVNRYIYPLLDKFDPRSTYVLRISIGMLLGCLSMVVAGTVEIYRQEAANSNHTVESIVSQHVKINGSDVSIFNQIPQYALMGLSEIFVLISGLEFAYCQAPKSMQSLVTSIYYMIVGLGAVLGSAFVWVSNAFGLKILWSEPSKRKHVIPPLDFGYLYYFFFFLAIMNFINWIGFLIYNRRKAKYQKMDLKEVSEIIDNTLENSLTKHRLWEQ